MTMDSLRPRTSDSDGASSGTHSVWASAVAVVQQSARLSRRALYLRAGKTNRSVRQGRPTDSLSCMVPPRPRSSSHITPCLSVHPPVVELRRLSHVDGILIS